MKEELCILCDEPTGKAGACEDSIFVVLDGLPFNTGQEVGPICETCYDKLKSKGAINTATTQ